MSVEPLARWGTIRWNSLQQDDSFWLERCAIFFALPYCLESEPQAERRKDGISGQLELAMAGQGVILNPGNMLWQGHGVRPHPSGLQSINRLSA
jgi:hypothetical protein